MVNKFIIFGPPGVGKGTLASAIAHKYNLEHISTGNIFREQISKQTPLGLQLKKIVETGSYVSDDITNLIVKNKLAELDAQNRGYILDGYPRTTEQLQYLFSLYDYQEFAVWILSASQDVILQRLSGRRSCNQCKATYHISTHSGSTCAADGTTLEQRADDQPQAILKRLHVYQTQTLQLKSELSKLGIVHEINANGAPNEVLERLERVQKFG